MASRKEVSVPIRKEVNEFPRRRPIAPLGGYQRVGNGLREELSTLSTLDSVNPRMQQAHDRLRSLYQYFRRAQEGPDSFYRALGVALLEHYCRKTTPLIEIENLRKWTKSQTGVTRVRAEAQEEFKTMQTVLERLSEDKRTNPGLTLFQLQNLLLLDDFDSVLVRYIRMIVVNTIEASAQDLGLTSDLLHKYQTEWTTAMAADDMVMQAAAWGFGVNLKVEDCVREHVTRQFASGAQEQRAVLTLLRFRRGFVVLYQPKTGLIDGYNGGEFSTDPATQAESNYARDNYGQFI